LNCHPSAGATAAAAGGFCAMIGAVGKPQPSATSSVAAHGR